MEKKLKLKPASRMKAGINEPKRTGPVIGGQWIPG